jgi:cytochrome c-type biogenesis protein CcmH/NrfG
LQEQSGKADEIRRLRAEEAELLERDASLAPDNAQIHYQLGLLRYLLGRLDEAQTALTEASRLAPQNFDYLMALALLHEKRYELSGAEEQLRAAAETLKQMNDLQPRDPRTRQIFARLLATQQAKEGEAAPPTPPSSADE